MSRSVDERVIQMKFDNKDFEKNVKDSLGTLDKLKSSLEFDKQQRQLTNLQTAFTKFDLTKFERNIASVADHFTTFGIMTDQVIRKFTSNVYDAGKNLLKSLSIDQVTAGWSKYESKTASVQTIMNATGKSIDEVNGYLDKLMWFSDETSFGFTDMTAALGQMTSSGGKIEKLVPMIEGVANATAFAGKGAAEFSRVMYNLNQSYASGALKYMDWRSLEMAGVASKQLKQTLIDTAVEMGRIVEGEVDLGNFSEKLKDDWADQAVMEKAFGKFAQATEEAYKLVKVEGEFDSASDAYESLAGKYDEIYYRAARAAQEAKTFEEAIDATKDAVSSGWMKTFELIFGNYDEARVLWTDMANSFWEIFASGAQSRNELLAEWHLSEIGGYADFRDGITNLLTALEECKDVLGQIVYDILPDIDTPDLTKVVKGFRDFTEQVKVFLSGKTSIDLEQVMHDMGLSSKKAAMEFIQQDEVLSKTADRFREAKKNGDLFREGYAGIISLVNILRKGFVTLKNSLAPLGKVFKSTGKFLLNVFAGLGHLFRLIDRSIEASEGFRNAVQKVADVLSDLLDKGGTKIYNFFKKAFQWDEATGKLVFVGNLIDGIKDKFGEFDNSELGKKWKATIDGIKDAFGMISDFIADCIASIPDLIPYIVEGLYVIAGALLTVTDYLGRLFSKAREYFQNNSVIDGIKAIAGAVWEYIEPAILTVKEFFSNLNPDSAKEAFAGVVEFLKQMFGAIGDFIAPVTDKLKEFWDLVKAGNFEGFKNLMSGFLAGGGLIGLISLTKSGNKFISAGKDFIKKLTGIGDAVEGLLNKFKGEETTGTIVLKIAIALGLLAGALMLLASLNTDQIVNATYGLAVMLSLLTGFLKVLKKLSGQSIWRTTARNGLLGAILGDNTKFVNGMSPLSRMTTDLIKLGVAVTIFAAAMKIMASIDPKAMSSVVIGLGAITAFAAIIGKLSRSGGGVTKVIQKNGSSWGKNLLQAGKGIIVIAAAMLVFSKAMDRFGEMDPEALMQAILAISVITGIIAVLGVVGSKFGKGLEETSKAIRRSATAILIAAIPLAILAGVIALIGKCKPATIGKGLFAIGGAITILAIGLRYINIDNALALMAVAGALLVLVPVIALLGNLPLDKLIVGLLAVAGGIAVFGLLSKFILPAAKGLDLLSSSLLKFVAATAILVGALVIIGKFGSALQELMITGAKSLYGGIVGSLPIIIATIDKLLFGILDYLVANIGPIADRIIKIALGVLYAIAKNIRELTSVLVAIIVKLIAGVAQGIRDNSQELANALTELLESIVNLVLDLLETLVGKIPLIGPPIAKAIKDLRHYAETTVGGNVELKYSVAASQYEATGEQHYLDEVLEGLNSEDAKARAAAIEAFKGLKEYADRHKDDEIEVVEWKDDGGNVWRTEEIDRAAKAKAIYELEEAYNSAINWKEIDSEGAKNGFLGGAFEGSAEEVTEEGKDVVSAILGTNKAADKAVDSGGEKVIGTLAKAIAEANGVSIDGLSNIQLEMLEDLLIGGEDFEVALSTVLTSAVENADVPEKEIEEKAEEVTDAHCKSIEHDESKIKKAYESTFGKGLEVVKNLNIKLSLLGEEAGNNYVKGIIKGMDKSKPYLDEVTKGVGQSIDKTMRHTLQEKSPSRLAEDIGMFWDLGIVQGLLGYAKNVNSASEDTASNIVDSFSSAAKTASNLMNGEIRNSDVSPVMSLGNTRALSHLTSVINNQNGIAAASLRDRRDRGNLDSSTNYNTKNYGGFTITVNAAPGQNPRELARVIMDEIQAETQRKEAALA